LNPEARARLPEIIRTAWGIYPRGVVEKAQKNHYEAMLEDALSGDPEQSARLDKMLDKKKPEKK